MLICPFDRSALIEHASSFECLNCARRYKISDGVVCMLEVPDEFYEGAYQNQTRFLPRSERLVHVWPLWLINSGYPWFVRKYIPQGATVVELGCAGGVRYFGKRYHMIGCDLSHASLKILDFYSCRIQANAASCIALPDESVDAVVSSYFWEHMPKAIKEDILKECQRILKPGGKLVFLYDVETANPLIRRFKAKQPALYKKLFIDGDGHLGYETPVENISLLKVCDFEVIEHRGLEKTWFQSPSAYEKLSHFDGGGKSLLKFFATFGRQPLFYPYLFLMRLIDTLVCPLLPDAWARMAMVVAQKPLNQSIRKQ